MRMISVVMLLALGAAAGWLCRQVPIRPIAQDVGAAVVGWIIGSVGTVLFTLFTWRPPGGVGVGAVSFGLAEADILGIPAAIVLALAGRLALRRLGSMGPAVLGTHAAIFLGGVAALFGALWVARGILVSSGG